MVLLRFEGIHLLDPISVLDHRDWSIEFKTTPDPAHFPLTKRRLSVQSSEHYSAFHTIVPLKTDMLSFVCTLFIMVWLSMHTEVVQ